MQLLPAKEDYISILHHIVRSIEREYQRDDSQWGQRGRRLSYSQRLRLGFFVLMHLRGICAFKTQRRGLEQHPAESQLLGFCGQQLPHRSTLSRRFRALAPALEHLVMQMGQWGRDLSVSDSTDPAPELAPELEGLHLVEDKSLFKACGPVWHQKDRLAGSIPVGLRHLDTDASWSKSAYHGWVYGYGLHLTVDQTGFPQLAQVHTASYSEAQALSDKEALLLSWSPREVSGDDAYTNGERARNWATEGVVLLASGLKLGKKGEKGSYKAFLQEADNQRLLKKRKTTIEPIFDLISHVAGTHDNHKQLPVGGLQRVQTYLLLAVVLVQLAMILNAIWGLPARNVVHMVAVMT